MTYAEAIQFLNSLSRFGWRLELERMMALCERLEHPERAFETVHVAGTNGKGSTATFLARILQASGILTGLYTSPHLYDGRERICIDNQPISEEAVAELVAELLPHIQEVNQQHAPVTEFEAWTCVMFMHFRRQGVKIAVVEAGLGGRWDSTNVIRPVLAILTNVSLDHTDRLGNTLAEIAHDKAGIIKQGGKILCGALAPEAAAEVAAEAIKEEAQLYELHSERDVARAAGASAHHFYWESSGDSHLALTQPDGDRVSVTFGGPQYQASNAALAAAASTILRGGHSYPISDDAITTGLSQPIPGRFEIISHSPEVILDAAHNTAAAAVLAAELSRAPWTPGEGAAPDLRIVFGGSSGHDAEGCLRILAPLALEVILTRAKNSRARRPEELAQALTRIDAPWEIIPEVKTAVETAIQRSRPQDRVCVTGSFFVLGELRGLGRSRQ